MKIERERLGITQRSASREVDWSTSMWGELERGKRSLAPPHWIAATQSLNLSPEDVVRRLNAFITKFPSIWLERRSDDELKITERPITSPRALRSGKIVNVDLNRLRPNLFYELSAYVKKPEDIIEQAVKLGFFNSKEMTPVSSEGRQARTSSDETEHLLEMITQRIQKLPLEKLKVMERVVDKFERFSSRDIGRAYKHFSLSVSGH